MLRRDLPPLDAYLADATSLDDAAFVDRHPWPVLVTPEPSPDVLSKIRRPDTVVSDDITMPQVDPMAPGMVGASLDALCLELRPLDRTQSRILIGRSPGTDIVLIDESVSRHHAELRWDRATERGTLCDLETKNGTFVDQKRLDPRREVSLAAGTVIAFGALVTRYYPPRAFRAWLATGAPRSGASPGKWPGT
jgi:hypothetical protein